KPEHGTRFHIVGRPEHRGFQRTLTTDPFFSFHHVNSFQEEDYTIHVDLVAYPNADIIQQLYLKELRQGKGIDFGRLRRYRVDVKQSKVELLWESAHALE